MQSRREFLGAAGVTALLGPALLEQSVRAAARARAVAAAQPTDEKLFDLEKVAEGVYAALARPQLFINSNACIIVNEDDVMVVDTHSKLSAARALILQIRRELTSKPVRYVVNTHFHFDHAQGNHAYPASFPGQAEIVSSEATHRLLAELGPARLQESLEGVPKKIEDLRRQMAEAAEEQEKATIRSLLAQAEAYQKEMRNAPLDLPTVTFDQSLVLRKKRREIHLLFLGRAHTAGDIVVFLPQEKMVATGDLLHGFLPYFGDGFPGEWPDTLKRLRKLQFTRVSPGHAGVQEGNGVLDNFLAYIEELTALVRAGKQKGRTIEELQKEITPASLRSLQANGYLEALRANFARATVSQKGETPPVEGRLADNIAEVYRRLEA